MALKKRNKLNAFSLLVIKKNQKWQNNFLVYLCIMWYLKDPFFEKSGKLAGPSAGAGVVDTVAGTAVDMFVHHSLPWMGKKGLEIRRCYGSEVLRNPKLQRKATIYYTLDRLNPMIQNVGAQAMNQLSTKLRPTKKYKTNRKDLDGGAVDIHKLIGKIPKPKGGWTPGKYKYVGP